MGTAPLLAAVALACSVQALAQGVMPPPAMSQGELLYATHCISCHTKEIHWREKKLATDWKTLVAQVRRWQENNNLKWSEEDIVAVAHYLNGIFYRFQEPEQKKIGGREPGVLAAKGE